jgi:hypothetical protein
MMIIIKKIKKYWLLLLSLAIAVFFLMAYHAYFNPSTETLNVKTFRVSGGWGYQIYVHKKLFIDQPYIPVIQGNRPFPDQESALKAANTVKAKMLQGKSPSLTMDDILKTGVDSLGNSN